MDRSGTTADIKPFKLFPPAVRPDAVVRRAIIDRVLRAGAEPLTVLQGAPGSGKTSTLSQLIVACTERRWACAWLMLEESDNDPQHFERHLRAALSVVRHGDPNSLLQRPPGVSLLQWVHDLLAAPGGPVAIFLDDFQVLHEPVLLGFFRDLLRHLPAAARLFIGSRALPDVGLATLLVNGQAHVIRAVDLHFSPVESRAFFAGGGAQAVAPDEIAWIHQRTEGWPAGLQLFRLALPSLSARRSLDELAHDEPRELADYMSENVIEMQPPQVRDFLLRTAILRRLSAGVCDRLAERSDSDQVLRELERVGLFVSALDPCGRWFRYHRLFAAHLQDRLVRTSPESLPTLHRLAAEWHMVNGSREEAVHHALSAGLDGLASAALNEWATQLIASAELSTVERWYERLPLGEVERHPDLMIKVAWSLIFLRRTLKLRPLLARLEALHGQGDVAATTSPSVVLAMAAVFRDDLPAAAALAHAVNIGQRELDGFPAFELGAASNLLAYDALERGDPASAEKLLVVARSHNARSHAAFSTVYAATVTAIGWMLAARPDQVLRESDARPPDALRCSGVPALAALAACEIWAAYETGRFDQVERLAERYEVEITRVGVPDLLVVALVSLSRVHAARGRVAASRATLDTLEQIAFDSGWPRVIRLVDWERMRVALRDGQAALVQAIAHRVGAVLPMPPDDRLATAEVLVGELLGNLRLAVARQDWPRAEALLASVHRLCEVRPLLRVKALVLEAAVHAGRGQAPRAHRAVSRAVALAAPGGCLRALLDETPQAVQWLATLADPAPSVAVPAAADRGQAEWIRRVLAEAGVTPVSRASVARPLTEALSEREGNVLRLLCEGLSNREIADRLALSENTVKFHMKNVFGKLGVSRRVQAVGVARRIFNL